MLCSAHGVVVDFAELSDAGRDPSKQVNEDSSGYAETPLGHLAVVCDGMGGHDKGRAASQAAVVAILDGVREASPGLPPGLALKQAVERAGRAVYALGGAGPNEHRPGSTCVAALLHPGGAELCHAGDSRAYRVHAGQIERVTRDHSLVQELVSAGRLTPEQARTHPDANQITRALGIAPEVNPESRATPLALSRGDLLLLASDGLTDLVTDAEILEVVNRRLGSGTAAVCQELVGLANSRGGHDNITTLVLSVVDLPAQVAAHGTVIQDGVAPTHSGTLLANPEGTLSDPGPGPPPTLFDGGSPAPHPTLPGLTQVDTGDRHTEPGLTVGAARFRQNEVDLSLTPGPTPSSRMVLWLGVGLVLTVLAAVGAWAVVRALHQKRAQAEEILPPPEVRVPPRPTTSAPAEDAEIPPADAPPPPSDASSDSADAGS